MMKVSAVWKILVWVRIGQRWPNGFVWNVPSLLDRSSRMLAFKNLKGVKKEWKVQAVQGRNIYTHTSDMVMIQQNMRISDAFSWWDKFHLTLRFSKIFEKEGSTTGRTALQKTLYENPTSAEYLQAHCVCEKVVGNNLVFPFFEILDEIPFL